MAEDSSDSARETDETGVVEAVVDVEDLLGVGDSNSVPCDGWTEAGDARLYCQGKKIVDLYSLKEESLGKSACW